jgi:hypothetical protein
METLSISYPENFGSMTSEVNFMFESGMPGGKGCGWRDMF